MHQPIYTNYFDKSNFSCFYLSWILSNSNVLLFRKKIQTHSIGIGRYLKNYIDEVRQLSQVFCVYWYYLKGYYRITDKDLC